MESPNPINPDPTGTKRKRSIDDGAVRPPPLPIHGSVGVPTSGAAVTKIDYMKKGSERLRLIEEDAQQFGDVLSMIDDYEGKSASGFSDHA